MDGKYDPYFVGIGSNEFRRHLLGRLEKNGAKPATFIQSSAYIGKSAKIGVGTIIAPTPIVNTDSVIGKGWILSVWFSLHNVAKNSLSRVSFSEGS